MLASYYNINSWLVAAHARTLPPAHLLSLALFLTFVVGRELLLISDSAVWQYFSRETCKQTSVQNTQVKQH